MTIGQRINLLRLQHELTIRQLAKKSYISESTLSSWIYRGTHPDIELLIRIADVFDVSLDELVGRDFPREASDNSCTT